MLGKINLNYNWQSKIFCHKTIKMKKLICLFIAVLGVSATAQVKIGTNPQNIGTGSLLELESSNKALLIPRVANTAAIANPINGMVIFDISLQCVRGYANNVWTACNFKPMSPCTKPTISAVAGTGTIAPGGNATFSVTASNYTSMAWTVKDSAGNLVYSGTTLNTGALTFGTVGTYTINFVATNAAGDCTTNIAQATGNEIVSTVPPVCGSPLVTISGPASVAYNNSGAFTLSGSNFTAATWTITPGSYSGSGTTATIPAGAPVSTSYTVTFNVTNNPGGCTSATASVSKIFAVSPPPGGCSTPLSCKIDGVIHTLGVAAHQSPTPGYAMAFIGGTGFTKMQVSINGGPYITYSGLNKNACYSHGANGTTLYRIMDQPNTLSFDWTVIITNECGNDYTRSGHAASGVSPNF